MSDIFVSYKREEQSAAKKLADALEKEGWTVWWDPKLRAGERFDEVIEAALKESKCVVVMWSRLSVNSEYVKDEARYALSRKKLVPVKIEEVELPFRFEGLHTPRLAGWDGFEDSTEYRKLVTDIAAIIGASQQTLKPGAIFRDVLKNGSKGPEMVVVPAGTFRMGDIQGLGGDEEKPVHAVRIPALFAMGRYPITFEDYDQFASEGSRQLPNDQGWGRGRRPVINVSWEDAIEYAKWLSEQTGKRYRLPTEAEWEYSARAGTETAYWWGNEMKSGMANCAGGDARWGGTSPAGSFLPNPFGLYDTAGNVWEWVEDTWHANYDGMPTDWSVRHDQTGGQRVIRGGSWAHVPEFLRSSVRVTNYPDFRLYSIGFRIAHDIE